jgi:hypothetical protein
VRRLALIIAVSAVIGPTGAALAESSTAIQAQKSWLRGDKCAADAFKRFPDYTAEQNAKRDAYIRQCRADLGEAPIQPLTQGK